MPIVNYEKLAINAEHNFFTNKHISKKNKNLVKKFWTTYDVSNARKAIFLKHIIFLLKRTVDISKDMHNRDKINSIFKKLRDSLSTSYYATVVNVSLRFVRWLNNDEKPKGFKDLKNSPKKAQKRNLSPKDMITWEDVQNLIKNTNSVQLKAIIACQCDGGFRPSEFVDINYGDITIKKEFIIVQINEGKTGSRPVILWRTVPHLLRWLHNHPTKNRKDPLWIQESGTKGYIKRYNYKAMQSRIASLFEKLGLDKPSDFYNLRHSAVCISKMDNIPEEEAAKKFGHSLEYYSNTYGRLSTEDSIQRFSKVYGIEVENKQVEKTIKCQKCDFVNEPSTKICEKCGGALTMEKALELERTKNQKINELEEQIKNMPSQIIELLKEKPEVLRKALEIK